MTNLTCHQCNSPLEQDEAEDIVKLQAHFEKLPIAVICTECLDAYFGVDDEPK